jgi:hypothetical protein
MQPIRSISGSVEVRHSRHLWRVSAVAASVVITLSALFVEGFPPQSWKAWFGISDTKPVAVALVPRRIAPGPVTATISRPGGNDSSASAVPLPLVLVSTRLDRNSREGFAHLGVDARKITPNRTSWPT